jgi:glycerophosphoryl diester phosphodiesterase
MSSHLVRALFVGATWAVAPLANAQLIIAHRGASYDAPENTLAAFREAWKQGADGIEADFYLSSDGKIVCFHDKDTERVAGVKHVIKDTTLDVLRSLDVGAWKHPRFRGERAPTFDEVAAIVPKGKTFFIELKIGPEIVPPLVEAIKASKLDRKRTVIISFKADTIAACEAQMPDIRTFWLTDFKQQEDTGRWKPTRDEVLAALDRSDADGLGPKCEMKVVDEPFLDALCDAGHCEFSVWTVDEPRVARYYKDQGAWAITTNRPGWLRSKLESAKKPVPAALK